MSAMAFAHSMISSAHSSEKSPLAASKFSKRYLDALGQGVTVFHEFFFPAMASKCFFSPGIDEIIITILKKRAPAIDKPTCVVKYSMAAAQKKI